MEQEKTLKVSLKRRFPTWIALSLFFIFMFLFTGVFNSLFVRIYQGIGGSIEEGEGMVVLMLGGASMLCASLTSSLILLYFEGRTFSDLGLSLKGRMADILYGTLVALGIYAIGFGVSLLLGIVEVTGSHFDLKSLIVMWLFFLLVAFYEEISVRGYILGRLLCTPMNKFLSLFVSSLLFALLHLFNPNIAVLPMVNLVLAGMLLGATYLYTHNLWFPIALHLFWNWIQGPILGYQVSGNKFLGTSYLTLRLPENNLLNGGTFGFEGSVICTVLLVISTLLIVWQCEKKEELQKCISNSSEQ